MDSSSSLFRPGILSVLQQFKERVTYGETGSSSRKLSDKAVQKNTGFGVKSLCLPVLRESRIEL